MIYLDYNSSTPVDPGIIEIYRDYLNFFGNPSNVYAIGREAKKLIEEARQRVAECINAGKDEIVFSPGGTFSNNIALQGIAGAYGKEKKTILCSMTEHPSVLNTVNALSKRGFKATFLPVDREGIIKLDILKNAIDQDTLLIACMMVNNETGSIQPVEEIGRIAAERGIFFHSDGVQAMGKIPIDCKKLDVHTISASAHKVYGPKGVGFLYIRNGVKLAPMIYGGHQERELFPGTENLPGIIAFSFALKKVFETMRQEAERELKIKKLLYDGLRSIFPGITLNGSFDKTVCNTLNVSFPGKINLEIMNRLDEKNIFVATGSACKTGEEKPSHVLLAMGLRKKEYDGAIRISLGKFIKEDDVPLILQAFREALR